MAGRRLDCSVAGAVRKREPAAGVAAVHQTSQETGLAARPPCEPITAWERPEPTGSRLAYFRHAPPSPLLFLASTHRLRASIPAQWPEQALLCCSSRPAGGPGWRPAHPTPRLHGPSETQFLSREWV